MTTRKVLKKVCAAIRDKKGEDLIVLDLSDAASFTDFFVICQGNNQKQNQTICDAIRETLKKENQIAPRHVEGYREADWILMDYLDFVVHIFSPQSRHFYKLERLWSDGIPVKVRA